MSAGQQRAYDPLANRLNPGAPSSPGQIMAAADWSRGFFVLCVTLFSFFFLLAVRLAMLGVFSMIRYGVARLAVAMGIVAPADQPSSSSGGGENYRSKPKYN